MTEKTSTSHNTSIRRLVNAGQDRVRSGETKSVQYRINQLKRLKEAIQRKEPQVIEALRLDLGKPELEAYATEIGYLYDSIKYAIKHLATWAKPKRVRTPLMHLGSKSYIYPEPYGSVLIVGPFNYPFMLVLDPLVGAIAAGNSAVIKPSEYTPNVSRVIAEIIGQHFDESYIAVLEGGKELTSELIHAPFDCIFFTGSIQVGKIVMEAAAKNLVPVILELGGKSPVIVAKDASIEAAAQRIVWGKLLNTGQTCVAPDYVLVHKDIKPALVEAMAKCIRLFYGENPQQSSDYGRIVNERHWDRLYSLLEGADIVCGGHGDRDDRYLAPTILDRVHWEDKVMEEEIFGPILPVLEFDNLQEVIQRINDRPKPLALYLFTNHKETEKLIMESLSFGGGCVNDTMLHLTSPHLPFGGVGSSGMGAYHGFHSFDAFSHNKSVMKRSTRLNLSFIYPPYGEKKLKMLRKFMK